MFDSLTGYQIMPHKDAVRQRESYKKLYAKSPERREAIKKSASARVKRSKRVIDGYKIFLGCIDCGYNKYPEALDFDHRIPSDKKYCIAAMVRSKSSLPEILKEIFKCDVRCANCHRVRHLSFAS